MAGDGMITIQRADYEKMLRHAERELPDEACGLIAGVVNGEDREIREVYLLTNTDHSDKHFSLAPKEQFAAIRDMRTKGLVLLGSWHSHPATPSRPSAEDQRLVFDGTGQTGAACLPHHRKRPENSGTRRTCHQTGRIPRILVTGIRGSVVIAA